MASSSAAGVPPGPGGAAPTEAADEWCLPLQEQLQQRSDYVLKDHTDKGWLIAQEGSPSPTLISELYAKEPERMRLWVGPLDAAVDLDWLREMEVGRCTIHE